MIEKHSTTFLNKNRFDVCAKLIYIRFLENNWKSRWGEDVYFNHLKVWNDFKETLEEGKNEYDRFVNRFQSIISSMKTTGFDPNSPVFVDQTNSLINGSHRLSAAIYFNEQVHYEIREENGNGQRNCDYYYFENKKDFVNTGLIKDYSDAMAIEYSRYKNETFILVLFPIALQKINEVEKIIFKNLDVVYKRGIRLNTKGFVNFIYNLYLNEPWICGPEKDFYGARVKSQLCFGGCDYNDVMVYLVEKKDENYDLFDTKSEIRKLFDIGNHSVHINDTHQQTTLLAETFFNENGISAMNSYSFDESFVNFNRLLYGFQKYANSFSEYCIVSSAVMSLFGLRDCEDFDYIGRIPREFSHVKTANNHESQMPYYRTYFDDIIWNPKNHFYFNGVKFCTLNVVREMKQNRKETKDIADIKMIENFINGTDR